MVLFSTQTIAASMPNNEVSPAKTRLDSLRTVQAFEPTAGISLLAPNSATLYTRIGDSSASLFSLAPSCRQRDVASFVG